MMGMKTGGPMVATTQTEPVSLTAIGELVGERMAQKGVTIKDLAAKLEITYEHVRRIVRGEGVPSKFVLKMVCEELGIPVKEAERLATADKIRRKYGSIPAEIAGKKPGLEPIERVWDRLTPDQQNDAVSLITGWAKRNKAVKAS